MHWLVSRLILWIKFWMEQLWRPTTFTVCYVLSLGSGCDIPTRYRYRRLENAQAKINQLYQMTPQELECNEGIPFPLMFRIEQVTAGHPLTRLLNLTGRKRLYEVFGYYI